MQKIRDSGGTSDELTSTHRLTDDVAGISTELSHGLPCTTLSHQTLTIVAIMIQKTFADYKPMQG